MTRQARVLGSDATLSALRPLLRWLLTQRSTKMSFDVIPYRQCWEQITSVVTPTVTDTDTTAIP